MLAGVSFALASVAVFAGAMAQPAIDPACAQTAQQVLARHLELCSRLETARGDVHITSLRRARDDLHSTTKVWTQRFMLRRPDKLTLRENDVEIYADGRTLTVIRRDLGQYTQRPQPAAGDLEGVLNEIVPGRLSSLPKREILLKPPTIEAAFPRWSRFAAVTETDFRGGPVYRLIGEFAQGASSAPLTMYCDRPSGRIMQVSVDLTRLGNEELGRAGVDVSGARGLLEATHSVDFAGVQLNPDIPDHAFSFTPRANESKVDSFDESTALRRSMQELVGQVLPDLGQIKDLSGGFVDRRTFAGKVLVLDVWATWCAPCLAALPKFQALADRLRGQPVLVLGVNVDNPAQRARAIATVRSKELTFAQIDGSAPEMQTSLCIHALPALILVGPDGVVRYAQVGAAHALDDLEQRVLSLLNPPASRP